MSKKRIVFIILTAFIVGVIVALGSLFILQKHNFSAVTIDGGDYMGTVVLDGFEISIPNKNMAVILEGDILSYCDDGSFDMGISVVDGSYEETRRILDSLDRDISEWFKLKKGFEEITVDGRSYIYCVYEDDGDTILLAYRKADEERSFEIMVQCMEVDQMRFQSQEELVREYESFILIADSLLGKAKTTNAVNTSVGETFIADDMYSKLQVEFPEEFKSTDALYNEDGDVLVEYQVEENFYMFAKEIKPYCYSMKTYSDMDRNIDVTIVAGSYQGDVKQLMLDGSAEWTDAQAEVESTEINGKIFYYYTYTETYKQMDKVLEKYYLEAATNLDSGTIYRISASSSESPEAAELDTYRKFLLINE